MRAVLDEYDERLMVGEIYLPLPDLVKYYGQNLDECHLPFNFQLIAQGDFFQPTLWQAQTIRRVVEEYEAALPPGAWPNWVLGNHDVPRVATRFGAAQARTAAMLLLTLRGTPTVYYGEEIGLENVPIPPELVQDPPAVNQPDIADIVGRDPNRTPMQWDSSPNAGFTAPGVAPWLPLAADYAERNVAKQDQEPTSMLNLYRALTALRRAEPALNVGDYASVETGVDDVLAYLRTAPAADRFLVVLNFESNEQTLNLSRVASQAEIAVSTTLMRQGEVDLARLALCAHEGLVIRLN
jgi:alpha-glucosidase